MNLPEEFTTYTQELMGKDLFAQYLSGMEQDPPTSIRLNPFKCDGDTLATESEAVQIVPWCPSTGRYLAERKNFTFDPLFHAGMYYVQEASSMFVDLAIRQYIHHPVRMLDLCAAPGGKSTAVRAALPAGSLLFSNEPMRTRSQILAENIQKFGHPDVIVTNNYPKDYKKSKIQFDVILTDVPCSGEGMFRKDEGAINEWSEANVNNCWQLQRDIVSDIWNCLKPGGILIYSTCTFNAHEDEENVDWIQENLDADILPLEINPSWNITGSLTNDKPMYHFIPGKTKGEGLFLAVLRKKGEADAKEVVSKNKKGKKGDKKKQTKMQDIPSNWLNESEGWERKTVNDNLYVIPSQHSEICDEALKNLKVIHLGIQLGQPKGKDFIPDQSLALSTAINKEAFPQVELSYQDAIKYLRKESLVLPSETPKGFVLVTYHSQPLGWMKNIGNRANNLYPQEWKIKSTHIPDKEPDIISSIS